jgi:thiosulfate/3-mercaptopyruvate sulfurtransferase
MKGFLQLLLVAALTSTLFAKSDILVEPEEAAKLLGKDNVVFVSGDNPDSFELYHIVGSVEMYAHGLQKTDKMGKMDCPPMFMCIDDAEKLISSKGISNDTLVIAYDNFRGPNATGVYHFFKSFGHENVKILNGGFDAMKAIDPNQKIYDQIEAEGKAELEKLRDAYRAHKRGTAEYDAAKAEYDAYNEELQAKLDEIAPKLYVQRGKAPKITPTNYKIDPNKIDLTYIAPKEEVYNAMLDIQEKGKKNSNYVILDSRGMTELIGERYLDQVARAGHIPGATSLEWNNITDFDNIRSFKSLEEMEKFFKDAGITKDKTIYAYCHVGAGRSSHLITALQLLGYENIKIYSGSWNEWGNDMSLPVRR